MYKLHLWLGPDKDLFLKKNDLGNNEGWEFVSCLEEASELTIEWIQKWLGEIILLMCPERTEILQVREHSK